MTFNFVKFILKFTFTFTFLISLELCDAKNSWCLNEKSQSRIFEDKLSRAALRHVDDVPKALPKLRTEGLLPGQENYDESFEAKKDFKKLENLSIGWKVSKNRNFLLSAEKFIFEWVSIYKPAGNPIDETNFGIFFKSLKIIEDDIDDDLESASKAWILNFYNIYYKNISRLEVENSSQTTNWHSHRIKVAVIAAAALNSEELVDSIEPYFHSHIERNILPGGVVVDFVRRDSISYAVYSLSPILEAALTVKLAGKDWLSSDSISRKKVISAIDWLVPYINGSVNHVEFFNPKYRFDKVRSELGLPGHRREIWNPSNAREFIWMAAYFDKKYLEVARKISSEPPAYLEFCYGTP